MWSTGADRCRRCRRPGPTSGSSIVPSRRAPPSAPTETNINPSGDRAELGARKAVYPPSLDLAHNARADRKSHGRTMTMSGSAALGAILEKISSHDKGARPIEPRNPSTHRTTTTSDPVASRRRRDPDRAFALGPDRLGPNLTARPPRLSRPPPRRRLPVHGHLGPARGALEGLLPRHTRRRAEGHRGGPQAARRSLRGRFVPGGQVHPAARQGREREDDGDGHRRAVRQARDDRQVGRPAKGRGRHRAQIPRRRTRRFPPGVRRRRRVARSEARRLLRGSNHRRTRRRSRRRRPGHPPRRRDVARPRHGAAPRGDPRRPPRVPSKRRPRRQEESRAVPRRPRRVLHRRGGGVHGGRRPR